MLFPRMKEFGVKHTDLGGRMGRDARTNVFFTQQVSRLWISMPWDVMDLKGLKGLKLFERKIHRVSGTPRCHVCSCSQKSLVTILREGFYTTAYFYVLPKVGNVCCCPRQDSELAGP